jgi:HTH-type transcriptional regulator / antitoxin HipB
MQIAAMDLSEIGILFRSTRREQRRTQAELARELGMSRATLSALEGGRCSEIGVRKLSALLEAVGLELFAAPRRARPTLDDLREEHRRARRRT